MSRCYLKYIAVFVFLTIWMSSCEFFESSDIEPAYIRVEQVDQTVLPGQGANSHDIRDVWAYSNNELLGIFTPPVDIPVIVDQAETEILLFAGIRNNGITLNPVAYAMLQRYEETLALNPSDTVVVNPVFEYRDDILFEYVEDFEGIHGLGDELDTIETNGLEVTSEEAFEGTKSGKLYVDVSSPTNQVASTFDYSTSILDGRSVYIELDYKNDALLFVGIVALVQGQTVKNYKLALQPKDDWNKIYVDITDEVNIAGVSDYKLAFGIELPNGETEATAYLDNVKLVHF